ncbi:F-box domain-containing protein [Mycena kentingensis (nom. inval.)]|nr:F-box domain-containing protein [Mycena kentingensis (nom. inval.)]
MPSQKLRNQIAQLEAQASQLLIQLADVRAQQADLQKELDAVCYPVLSLPPEIASHILLDALVLTNPFPMPAVARNRYYPLVLAAVCGTWRQIVLSRPEFWNRVTFYSSSAEILSLFYRWIDLTGNLPLDICLRLLGRTSAVLADELFSVAYPCKARWQVLQVCNDHSIRALLLWSPGSAPCLESFSAHGDIVWMSTHVGAFEAPALRELSLSTCGTPRQMNNPTSLQNLTTVTILRVETSSEYIFEMLALASNVRVADVEPWSVIPPPGPTTYIVLPALHTLTCRGPAGHVLARLTLPSLRALNLKLAYMPGMAGVLPSLLERSGPGCSIDKFSCHMSFACLKQELLMYLDALPDIAHLTLGFTPWPAWLFPTLLEEAPDSRRLTKLDALTLNGIPRDTDFAGLVAFVRWRRRAQQPLRRIDVGLLGPATVDPEIEELYGDGLEVVLGQVSSSAMRV